jgi:transketolase
MIKYNQLQYKLRYKLLEMYFKANAGHIGSSLSCIDILISIFANKKIEEKFILSKGHAAAALYAILNNIGEIDDETLNTFYQNGTKLSAHPSANSFPNIPFALGSLGHGLPIACGIAKANKIYQKNNFTYVLMSDGETNEGTTWEAAHFAIAHKLDNLILIIDKNKLQGFGNTSDVLGDTADLKKWDSIGFEVIEVDGHDIDNLNKAIQDFKIINDKPKLIIANTIKGKGVDYMENKLEWHYLPMDSKLFEEAKVSLNKNYNA